MFKSFRKMELPEIWNELLVSGNEPPEIWNDFVLNKLPYARRPSPRPDGNVQNHSKFYWGFIQNEIFRRIPEVLAKITSGLAKQHHRFTNTPEGKVQNHSKFYWGDSFRMKFSADLRMVWDK